MTLSYAALAIAAFSVCYVVFLKRAVDGAPEYVEPDIDSIIRAIEDEERGADSAPDRRDHLTRIAMRRAA